MNEFMFTMGHVHVMYLFVLSCQYFSKLLLCCLMIGMAIDDENMPQKCHTSYTPMFILLVKQYAHCLHNTYCVTICTCRQVNWYKY
jgi:hypothetical protein